MVVYWVDGGRDAGGAYEKKVVVADGRVSRNGRSVHVHVQRGRSVDTCTIHVVLECFGRQEWKLGERRCSPLSRIQYEESRAAVQFLDGDRRTLFPYFEFGTTPEYDPFACTSGCGGRRGRDRVGVGVGMRAMIGVEERDAEEVRVGARADADIGRVGTCLGCGGVWIVVRALVWVAAWGRGAEERDGVEAV